jgi:hypothetical protein
VRKTNWGSVGAGGGSDVAAASNGKDQGPGKVQPPAVVAKGNGKAGPVLTEGESVEMTGVAF